jgi:hypothetical protein
MRESGSSATFDDFLDHEAEYLKHGRKNEAAVIAGIVFEDTIRRICRVLSLTENGAALDTLIPELARRSPPVLTAPTAMLVAIGHASTGWIPAQQSASFSGAPKGSRDWLFGSGRLMREGSLTGGLSALARVFDGGFGFALIRIARPSGSPRQSFPSPRHVSRFL